MLEYKHLVSLSAIRETGSLNLAAKILNISVSALSHQIKDLEAFYDCSFFVRKTKPVRFTSAGETVLDLADRVIPLFRKAGSKLARYSNVKPSRFNMALECHSCYQWLLPTISEFRSLWSDMEVNLSAEFNFFPLPKLTTKELDLVITGDPNPLVAAEYQPLFDFELLIGVSERHPLASKKYLTPRDVDRETLLTYPVEEERLSILTNFLYPAGVKPYQIEKAELTMMLVEMVSAGRGVCCLPGWAWDEFAHYSRVKTLRMGKEGLRETLYAAYRHEDKNNESLRDFVRLAKKTCLNKLKGITLHKENS